MSKGLGDLQRDILACLDHPGTEVEPGVYDLRRVARYAAGYSGRRGAENWMYADKFGFPLYPTGSFSAAFSRAVRSLIERGELEEVDYPLQDGRLPSQIRFVRRPSRKRRRSA